MVNTKTKSRIVLTIDENIKKYNGFLLSPIALKIEEPILYNIKPIIPAKQIFKYNEDNGKTVIQDANFMVNERDIVNGKWYDKDDLKNLKEDEKGENIIPVVRNLHTDEKGESTIPLNLDKNKFGRTGVLDLWFDLKYQKFVEIDNRYAECVSAPPITRKDVPF